MDVDNIRAKPNGVEYHVYLVGEIGRAAEYIEEFDVLQNAAEGDIVFLHLNTPGGDLTTAIQFLHAIQSCKASVVGSADGEVASAGSIIFFACDGFIVNPFSFFLLHDGSGGVLGKVNDNLKAAQAITLLLHKIYHDVYGRFFKKKEIDKILNGEDMHLFSDEVEERLKKAMEGDDE